jgi:hypothetical protein
MALRLSPAGLAQRLHPKRDEQMAYSTSGFIESLKPRKRRLTTYFVDPITGTTYGHIFRLWPVTILKITGWHGERITVVKFFEREFVW